MQALLPKLSCPSLAAAAVAARARAVRVPYASLGLKHNVTCCNLVYALASHSIRAVGTRAAASNQAQQQQQQQQQQDQALTAEDAFYAEAVQSFADLGIAPTIVDAMQTAGFTKPSRVQELVVPKVLSGKDIVLAAETGSGKTLAYIAPLLSLLLEKAASGQLPPSPDAIRDSSSSSSSSRSSSTGYKPKPRPQPRWMGLVLCPNTALCHQVVRLVSSLQGASGQPVLQACHVSSSSPPPFDPPDIIVTTPGALKTLFNDRGAMYGSQWTAEAVALRAAFVVVDEADLLWQGGYYKDLTRLLDAFKAAERRMLEAQVLQELELDKSCLDNLPRNVKEALWRGGVPAMLKAGLTQPQIQRLRGGQQQQQQQQGRVQEPAAAAAELQEDAGAASSSSSSSSADELREDRLSSSQGTSSSSSSEGGSKQYGPYFKRQHLFVAATMPALTKGDVGTELQKRFQGALWVSGEMLHQVKPHVDHTWVRLGQDESAAVDDALLAAIQKDPDYKAGRARALVFTRNTANADRVSAFLSAQGVSNHVYHKNRSSKDQAAALEAMAHPTPDSNLIMVSTDAAARGIDLPQVTHVIQADFVENAIEFLHRVGRTARAGKSGKVTSLYGPSDANLANAVRKYVEAGEPVADCFSRNRSFSRKVKRYGKFVPRGQEGPQ